MLKLRRVTLRMYINTTCFLAYILQMHSSQGKVIVRDLTL